MAEKTLFYLFRGTFWEKGFVSISPSFSKKFSDFERNFSELWCTFDRQCLQASNLSADGSLWPGTFFSRKRDKYEKFLASEREFFGLLAKNISRAFRIAVFVSGSFSGGKTFVSKFSYFHESSRTLGEKFPELWPTLLGRAFKKTIHVSRGSKWRQTNFFKKRHLIIVIELWAKRFGFSKKVGMVEKVIFYASRGTFSEKNFALMSSHFHKCFRTLGEKLSKLWLTFAREGRQNRKIFSQRNFVTRNFCVWEK